MEPPQKYNMSTIYNIEYAPNSSDDDYKKSLESSSNLKNHNNLNKDDKSIKIKYNKKINDFNKIFQKKNISKKKIKDTKSENINEQDVYSNIDNNENKVKFSNKKDFYFKTSYKGKYVKKKKRKNFSISGLIQKGRSSKLSGNEVNPKSPSPSNISIFKKVKKQLTPLSKYEISDYNNKNKRLGYSEYKERLDIPTDLNKYLPAKAHRFKDSKNYDYENLKMKTESNKNNYDIMSHDSFGDKEMLSGYQINSNKEEKTLIPNINRQFKKRKSIIGLNDYQSVKSILNGEDVSQKESLLDRILRRNSTKKNIRYRAENYYYNQPLPSIKINNELELASKKSIASSKSQIKNFKSKDPSFDIQKDIRVDSDIQGVSEMGLPDDLELNRDDNPSIDDNLKEPFFSSTNNDKMSNSRIKRVKSRCNIEEKPSKYNRRISLKSESIFILNDEKISKKRRQKNLLSLIKKDKKKSK